MELYLRARTDDAAAAKLWRELQESVRPLAVTYGAGLDPDEIESAAGECFAETLSDFNGDGAFRGLFAQRFKHRLVEQQRYNLGRSGNKPQNLPADSVGVNLLELPGSGCCGRCDDDGLDRAEDRLEISDLFDGAGLDDQEREIVLAYHGEGLSYEELADRTGHTVDQLKKAAPKLLERLQRHAARLDCL